MSLVNDYQESGLQRLNTRHTPFYNKVHNETKDETDPTEKPLKADF